jgi:NAD(P)H dehydrogenase (quinone)
MPDTLLVTGATGHLGQRVLHHLVDTLRVPGNRIIATTRKPESLSAWAVKGVVVRTADFENTASLTDAFRGARRLLLISTDAIDRPGRRLAQHKNAIDAAVQAGVSHVVYTSMPEPEGSPVVFAPDHAGTEAALAASTLPGWTVLRNHWYFETLFNSLPGILARGGKWFSAAGDGKVANISRDDVGRAAACVLAGSYTGKDTFTLSGPHALSVAEQAAAITQAIDKPIQVIPLPVEALIQGMVGAGLPEPVAKLIASFDTNTAAGRASKVTGDFKAITGVEPQRFTDWLSANKSALLGA